MVMGKLATEYYRKLLMETKQSFKKISVIGLGYIGLPTAAMLATQGIEVVGVDVNPFIIEAVNKGKAHIEEGGLDQLLSRCVSDGNLKATKVPEVADVFLITVPTPVNGDHTPDLSYVISAGRSIASVLKKGDLVILESTSPVGTTRMLGDVLAEERPDLSFPHITGENSDIHIAYCPERIIPGKMLEELVKNDRIIGGITAQCSKLAVKVYKTFVEGGCHITDDQTAGMVKLSENAFRDINIAFANELSMICGDLGLDVWKVIEMANHHPRVSILNPGPGVGGHCIAVDPWLIAASAPKQTRLIQTARKVNDAKPDYVIEQVEKALLKLPKANVACLGLSYKANVDDFRGSPALKIAEILSRKYTGRVFCADPFAYALSETQLKEAGITLNSVWEVLNKVDVVVMLVGHKTFLTLSYPQDKEVIDTIGFWC